MKGDWKARRERVDAAVVAFDFLGWLAGRYGQVNPGRKSQLVRAPYREDRKPSLSLYQQGGVTFWKDQADGTSGTVLQWLTRHEGMSLPQAEDFLLEAVFGAGAAQLAPVNWANIRPQRQPEPEPAYTGPSEPTLRAFEEGQRRMAESGRFPAALADCPLDPDTATTWGLSAKGDEGLIGIFDLEGRIHAVKVRANSQTARYRYMDKGAHNPVWHCPYIQACEGTLTVFEGEKKAIAASAALFASEVSARWGVAGLPGASSRPAPSGSPRSRPAASGWSTSPTPTRRAAKPPKGSRPSAGRPVSRSTWPTRWATAGTLRGRRASRGYAARSTRG